MLTYSQCQIVAYQGDGAVYHEGCARERFGTLTCEKADAGLTNAYGLTPLIQYQIDEWASETAYGLAEERAYQFEYDHPALAAKLGVASLRDGNDPDLDIDRNRWRLIDRLADHYGAIAGPSCDECMEVIQ